jgi:hypothetical protein
MKIITTRPIFFFFRIANYKGFQNGKFIRVFLLWDVSSN